MSEVNNSSQSPQDSLIHENYAQNHHFDLHENDFQTCFGTQVQIQVPGSHDDMFCPDRVQVDGGGNPYPGPDGKYPYGVQVGVCYEF